MAPPCIHPQILAWMMQSQGWSLRQGMRFLTRLRPEAAPNAGYMAALLRLEEQLFGKQTVKVGRGLAYCSGTRSGGGGDWTGEDARFSMQ